MSRDLHVTLAGLLLVCIGLPTMLLAVLLVPTGLLIGTTEPEFVRSGNGLLYGFLVGAMEGVLIGGLGAIPLVAGVGILRGRRWAWALAVSFAALTLPSACLPVSGYLLYALLREDARRAFGVR